MLGSTIESEDESDESSSPNRNKSNQSKTALEDFREKWQKELQTDPSTINKAGIDVRGCKSKLSSTNISTDEARAKELFKQGVDLEECGKVYDALTYYRRAMQIVPDIEFRIYESAKKSQGNSSPLSLEMVNSDEKVIAAEIENIEEEDLSNVDLFARFENSLFMNGCFIGRANVEKGTIVTGLHISVLPAEIILKIFRWVVSAQLDLRSLEQCAAVCKGFYLWARDEELWRLACLKVWGVNTGVLKNSPYINWREMFIERHRVLFNGCYISKTSYTRYGENSYQDKFYRPIQKVEYYRYIRFFPNGVVLMMTSADDPGQVVGKLRSAYNSRSDILKGHFRLHADQIIIVLKRNQKLQNHVNNKKRGGLNELDTGGTETFFIELNIMSTSKRRFNQLIWKRYTFIEGKNNNDFELTTAKYPSFWFSRVKSYHLESDTPLQ